MKRIKKFYKNNRVYSILMIISVVCVALMLIALVSYFLGQTSSNPYGNRLDGIEQYNISDKIKSMEEFFKNEKKVEDASVRLQGKIIYATVTVSSKLNNEDIETLATSSLEKLSSEELEFFDVQYIFKRDKMPPYLGSKSSSNKIISWANYKLETDESEE